MLPFGPPKGSCAPWSPASGSVVSLPEVSIAAPAGSTFPAYRRNGAVTITTTVRDTPQLPAACPLSPSRWRPFASGSGSSVQRGLGAEHTWSHTRGGASERGKAKAIGFVPKTRCCPPWGATKAFEFTMIIAIKPRDASHSASHHKAEKCSESRTPITATPCETAWPRST